MDHLVVIDWAHDGGARHWFAMTAGQRDFVFKCHLLSSFLWHYVFQCGSALATRTKVQAVWTPLPESNVERPEMGVEPVPPNETLHLAHHRPPGYRRSAIYLKRGE
jgi:hypothetical protein